MLILFNWESFPGDSDAKESSCNAENLGSIPGSGISHGVGDGDWLQYSCLENPLDRGRSLAGYSPRNCKELDMTEQLILYFHFPRQLTFDKRAVYLRFTTWELRIESYVGQNEDCWPGESTSDNWETAPKRRCGGDSMYMILSKGEYMPSGTCFFQKAFTSLMKLSASHEKESSPWRILMLF